MPSYIAPSALLPEGWRERVLISVDEGGDYLRVDHDCDASSTAEALDGVVVPGVPNLHSHAFQRALAGLTERGSPGADTFWSWRESMYGLLAKLTPGMFQDTAALLFCEMLEAGYTSVGEFHYLHRSTASSGAADPVEMSLRVLEAARETGIGLMHLPTLYLSSDFGGAPLLSSQASFRMGVDDLLRLIETLASKLADDRNLGVGLAVHSLRAVPPEALNNVVAGFQGSTERGPIHIHVAEQRREVEACVAWSGAPPVEWLLDHVTLDDTWCLVHATHMKEEENDRVAASGAVVGLCPSTEANLGDGLFGFPRYLGAGGVWGIGSDSHVSVSPTEELRWLEYGQRLRLEARNVAAGRPDRSTGRALFEGAVAGGNRALGRRAGRIVAGERADLLVLDPDHPQLAGRSEDALLDSWIFSGNSNPVRHVMVGGRWVVRDGRHHARDAIVDRYRRVARAIGPGS